MIGLVTAGHVKEKQWCGERTWPCSMIGEEEAGKKKGESPSLGTWSKRKNS